MVRGIVAALGAHDLRKVALVVRLTGTNAKEGLAILAAAGYVPVETMDEGAARVVALAHRVNESVAVTGRAGPIISGNTGTPESKVAAFAAAGVPVAERPPDIPLLLPTS